MAKSFLVSPGRAYLVIAGEGTKIVRANGTLIDTVPEGANNVSITVDTHEIIVMDNAAKIQQLYNGNSGSNGIMTTAEGEDAGSWKIEIVSTLPEQGSAGVIYMLRTNRTGTDRYDDYIWIPTDSAYELLGRRPESTSVDLSGVAKTDVANTFTKDQRINGTLTATSIDVTRLSCDQQAEIGTADISYLNYDTAGGSSMTASHVTILTSLSVGANASVELPGVSWRKGTNGDYIDVTRKPFVDTVEIRDTAKVSNVLTLGSGDIELDGRYGTFKIKNAVSSVNMEPSCIQVLAPDATLALKGAEVTMQARSDSRTVFSVTQNGEGKFILNASDGAALGGTVSIPGTLNVKNLNVTGTVTGINAGGGTTPTVDFSNGVTIMQILTADDVVADTVAATTLSAGSSLSVSSEAVIYRHTDGAIYVHGDIVTATQVAATTFIPTNIQGATFTGPLVMTKDNALQVWNQGKMAEVRNGNITGFYYAQVDHCTVTHALSADSAKISRASITDTLVVKDLIVTGTTAGIPTGGGGATPPSDITNIVDGELWVNGTVTATDVLAHSLGLTGTSGGHVKFTYSVSNGSKVVTLDEADGDVAPDIYFATAHVSADTVSTEHIGVTELSAHTIIAATGVTINDTRIETIGNGGKASIDPGYITLSRNETSGVTIATIPAIASEANVSVSNVLMYGEYDNGSRSDMVVLRVPSIQIGDRWVSHQANQWDGQDPSSNSALLSLYNSSMSSMCCLQHAWNEAGMLQLQARSMDAQGNWNTIVATLTAHSLCTDHLISSSMTSLSVMSELVAENGMYAKGATLENVSIVGALYISSGTDSAKAYSLSVVNTLSAGFIDVDRIIVKNEITAPNLLTEDSLFTTVDTLHSTPSGNMDTLCRWAQIGSTHQMLEVGQLSSIMLPGPSVQKLPTSQTVTSFVLTLWYQADTAGNDIRLIGKSSNVVTPVAGTGSTNTWLFNDLEIKEEYLGHNLRLIMLPGTTTDVPSTWSQTVSKSEANKCYIQGRYTKVDSDQDCVVSASDSGNTLPHIVVAATFKVSKKKPISCLTDEQTALLDWLAANKDALANLLASASSST